MCFSVNSYFVWACAGSFISKFGDAWGKLFSLHWLLVSTLSTVNLWRHFILKLRLLWEPKSLISQSLLPSGRGWHPEVLGTLFPMGLWFYDLVGKAQHTLHCGSHQLPPICLFARDCIRLQRNRTARSDTSPSPPQTLALLRFSALR